MNTANLAVEVNEVTTRSHSSAGEGSEGPGVVPSCCAPINREMISSSDAKIYARQLRALADPARLRLVSIVAASHDKGVCVCDLTGPLELSQPTVSHHLKILMDAGFLTRSRRGTWAYYTLVPGALDAAAAPLKTT